VTRVPEYKETARRLFPGIKLKMIQFVNGCLRFESFEINNVFGGRNYVNR